VKQMIPETTGETNKSDADAASMAAGSIARRETNNNDNDARAVEAQRVCSASSQQQNNKRQ
jgi:hypothetical protein